MDSTSLNLLDYCTLNRFQAVLQGLTLGHFTVARKHATEFGHRIAIKQSTAVIHLFDHDQVEHVIEFITSEYVCTDLPVEERSLKLSSGMELFLPNTIRNTILTRIIQQYHLFCKDNSFGFCLLRRSSLYSSLDVCKAFTRKSLRAINYFALDAH